MNGDLITTVDVEDMLSHHVKSNALISISLWPVEDPTRFGVVDFDHNKGLIRRFQEKPSLDEAYSNLINAGCYIVERSVMQGLSTEYPQWSEMFSQASQSQEEWGVPLLREVHRRWNSNKLP